MTPVLTQNVMCFVLTCRFVVAFSDGCCSDDVELHVISLTYKDLAGLSKGDKGGDSIDKATFLQNFPVPGLVGGVYEPRDCLQVPFGWWKTLLWLAVSAAHTAWRLLLASFGAHEEEIIVKFVVPCPLICFLVRRQ